MSATKSFRFVNYGLTPVDIPLHLAIGADFADIFEVRGTRREKRGRRLEDQIDSDSILLSYEGLDTVVRRTRVQCHPCPVQISSAGLGFEISLRPKQSEVLHLVISCDPAALETLHRLLARNGRRRKRTQIRLREFLRNFQFQRSP